MWPELGRLPRSVPDVGQPADEAARTRRHAAPPSEGDPVAARSARLYRAFGWYLRWYFYRRFHAVRLSRTGLPRAALLAAVAGRPVIIYGNHPSWWDPALYILLDTLLFPGRCSYGPMDAKALGKYGLFERLGVFGIALDSPRGAARFLSTSLDVLSDPGNVLWITAEGEFTDPRRRPVRLRSGIAHLARRVPGAVILPLAIEYTFWNESKPEALARFGPPIESGGGTVAEWTVRLEEELAQTMDALTAESVQRDPALFEQLLHGQVGVGGIYDLWRRGRALAAGRRFDPRHEERE
jgi:1-acyl-sn-glycerol-3-phosphate acyltransferase